MMTIRLYQADPNRNHSRITCRSCIKIPLDMDGIDDSIDTQILNPSHIILFHLEFLYNGRNPDIGTLKKHRNGIFKILRWKL